MCLEDINKIDNLKEYDRRVTFWTEQSMQQLGYSLNLFLTLGIAFLGYMISIRKEYAKFHFNWMGEINWSLCVYYGILLLITLSLMTGILSITIRLYDLRVTRHIIRARKKTLKTYNKYLSDDYVDLTNENFIKTVLWKIEFIQFKKDKTFEEISTEFETLRKQAKIMGDRTWITHYWQIALFILAIIIFGISII